MKLLFQIFIISKFILLRIVYSDNDKAFLLLLKKKLESAREIKNYI